MHKNLSPKDLALVIGVSESSLKRWVDEGRLQAGRTAGGHRRIPMYEAVRFIRATNQSVVRPDLLGVDELASTSVALVSGGSGEAELLRALEAGQSDQARGIVVALFLAGRSVAGVFDGPMAYAMHRVGELWQHPGNGIMIEHRATEICLQAVHQIRLLLPSVEESAPVAVGAAAPSDPYVMASLMAATTLQEAGYRDINLGANTPIDTLIAATRQYAPALVWVSLSSPYERTQMLANIEKLSGVVHAMGSSLVLGGRAICGQHWPKMPSTHVVSSMSELAAFARGLRVRDAQPASVRPPAKRLADAV
jgi:MerR family transcriptional regulator, light-induced transcriptional regulator